MLLLLAFLKYILYFNNANCCHHTVDHKTVRTVSWLVDLFNCNVHCNTINNTVLINAPHCKVFSSINKASQELSTSLRTATGAPIYYTTSSFQSTATTTLRTTTTTTTLSRF